MANRTVIYSVLKNHLMNAFSVDDVIKDNSDSLTRVDQQSVTGSLFIVTQHVLTVSSLVRLLDLSYGISGI